MKHKELEKKPSIRKNFVNRSRVNLTASSKFKNIALIKYIKITWNIRYIKNI